MNNLVYSWILFLISPFVSVIFAFKDYLSLHSKNIFWAFCTFYGLTFAIGTESLTSDINRNIYMLQELRGQYGLTVDQVVQMYLSSGEIDMFNFFLTYVISRVTDSQAILTMVYGFIFGFFFSRNLWYVFNLLEGKLNWTIKIMMIALVLIVPIWNINGVRMYLAFHVFIYGLLPYIFEQRRGFLIFSFLTVLIHFSFVIPIIVLVTYLLLGNRLTIYFILFVSSIFVSEINITKLNEFTDNLTIIEAFADRSSSYRNEENVEEFRDAVTHSRVSWYALWYKEGLKWSLTIVLAYFFFFASVRIKMISSWKKIFSFSLLFFSISNILSNMPSGARFYIFAFFLSLIMIVLYLNQFKNDYKFSLVLKMVSPAIILFIIVSIRIGLYSTSITSIIGNPVLAMFNVGETVSLNDLIK